LKRVLRQLFYYERLHYAGCNTDV